MKPSRLVIAFPDWAAKAKEQYGGAYCKVCNVLLPVEKAFVDIQSGDVLCPRDSHFAGSMIGARKEKGWDKRFREHDDDRFNR